MLPTVKTNKILSNEIWKYSHLVYMEIVAYHFSYLNGLFSVPFSECQNRTSILLIILSTSELALLVSECLALSLSLLQTLDGQNCELIFSYRYVQ